MEAAAQSNALLVILNIGTALAVLLLGFILNSMRASFAELSKDLKTLNDAVLSNYMQREEVESRLREQRDRIHNVADAVQEARLRLAVLEAEGKQ